MNHFSKNSLLITEESNRVTDILKETIWIIVNYLICKQNEAFSTFTFAVAVSST